MTIATYNFPYLSLSLCEIVYNHNSHIDLFEINISFFAFHIRFCTIIGLICFEIFADIRLEKKTHTATTAVAFPSPRDQL